MCLELKKKKILSPAKFCVFEFLKDLFKKVSGDLKNKRFIKLSNLGWNLNKKNGLS